MLFHTWTFLVFMLVVVPVYFALGKTRLWLPWLTLASYTFYGWWNPYYLILVVYSTVLDYLLVLLMDHSPTAGGKSDTHVPDRTGRASAPPFAWLRRGRPSGADLGAREDRPLPLGAAPERQAWGAGDAVLRRAFGVSIAGVVAIVAGAVLGPATLRPTLLGLGALVFLMALGAWYASRRIWLLISLVNNLALLLFFKYARFVAENLNAAMGSMGLSARLPDPSTLMPFGFEYLLPAGISFFTFQSLSYTIDFYFGRVERERHFLRFATFVCFFPQLMAGPIERARHLLPQFRQFPPFQWTNLTDGLSLFLVGLFKKLALANYLSLYVDRVYSNPTAFDGSALFAATVAFAWQIFFDFSGYTDMARGVAKILGFNLILNFNNPYLATGLGEFWTRWHISLSSWFRDYVYIPLGGNRRGKWLMYRNLFITFLVSGIWHGASWTFAIWGMLHGIGVLITRELEQSAFYRDRVPRLAKQVAVFLFVTFTWVFFRAESMHDAMLVLERIATAAWRQPQIPLLMVLLIAAIWLYQFAYESRVRTLLQHGVVRVGLAASMILYLCLCSSGGGTFIYFQF